MVTVPWPTVRVMPLEVTAVTVPRTVPPAKAPAPRKLPGAPLARGPLPKPLPVPAVNPVAALAGAVSRPAANATPPMATTIARPRTTLSSLEPDFFGATATTGSGAA